MTVADIAGKTPEEVTQIFGSPTSTEIVKPSRTPCPCTKNYYQNGMIEIVFIEGKADWITINLPAKLVDISGSYRFVNQFHEDYLPSAYTYVKVRTD